MAQPTRPDDHLDWATDAAARKTSPLSGLRASGWNEGASPASDIFNYIQGKLGDWVLYFDKVGVPGFDTLASLIADRSRSSPSGLKRVGVLEGSASSPAFRETWSIDTADAGTGGDFLLCCSDGAYVYAVNDSRIIKIQSRTGAIEENQAYADDPDPYFEDATKMITNGTYVFVLNRLDADRIYLYRASDLAFERTITPPAGEEFLGMCADAARLYTYDAAGKIKAWEDLDTTPVVDWTFTGITGAAGNINAIATTGDAVYVGFDRFDPGAGTVNLIAINAGPSATGGTEMYRAMVGTSVDVDVLAVDEELLYAHTDDKLFAMPLVWNDATNNPAEVEITKTNMSYAPKLLAVSGRWMFGVSANIAPTTTRIAMGRKPAAGGGFRASWGELFDFNVNPSIRDACVTVDSFVYVSVDQGAPAGNKTIVGFRLPLRPQLIQVDELGSRYRAPFHGAVTEGC